MPRVPVAPPPRRNVRSIVVFFTDLLAAFFYLHFCELLFSLLVYPLASPILQKQHQHRAATVRPYRPNAVGKIILIMSTVCRHNRLIHDAHTIDISRGWLVGWLAGCCWCWSHHFASLLCPAGTLEHHCHAKEVNIIAFFTRVSYIHSCSSPDSTA